MHETTKRKSPKPCHALLFICSPFCPSHPELVSVRMGDSEYLYKSLNFAVSGAQNESYLWCGKISKWCGSFDNSMNDETVEAVIDFLERSLKQYAGIQTLEDAGKAIERFADILHQATPYCNRNRLIETLKQQNVTAEDEMLIRGVTKNFPAIALGLIELALPTVRKDFPALNSGRPKSLTSEEERAACEYIGKLHVEGLEMKIAKQRAAQKFNVSVPTINRTWAERKKGHIPSPKEILEIFKAKQANTARALPVSDEKSSENATRTSSSEDSNDPSLHRVESAETSHES
jgi:predicted metal-binding transcription factor (methanogenesis marker protein 9)